VFDTLNGRGLCNLTKQDVCERKERTPSKKRDPIETPRQKSLALERLKRRSDYALRRAPRLWSRTILLCTALPKVLLAIVDDYVTPWAAMTREDASKRALHLLGEQTNRQEPE
jgi:hypothetical protein